MSKEQSRIRRIGNDPVKSKFPLEGLRRRSLESLSTDSGINLNGETGFSLSQMASFYSSGKAQVPQRNRTYPDQAFQQAQFRSNSNNFQTFSDTTPTNENPHLSFPSQIPPRNTFSANLYPNTSRQQDNWDVSSDVVYQESPYEYGSIDNAPSSVYNEDIYQKNGWFFLSGSHRETSQSKENLQATSANQTLKSCSYPQYPQEALHETHNYFGSLNYPPINQSFRKTNYGSLSENFLTKPDMLSPLNAAITATCAKDYDYDTLPPVQNTGNAQSGDEKKRKSVRFSQTVQERIENSDSEIEDTTSIMKGSYDEEKRAPLLLHQESQFY